jgi:glucose/arabinose dehydrogenase
MKKLALSVFVCALVIACTHRYRATDAAYQGSVNTNNYTNSELPPPNSTKSTKNFSKVVGWPGALTPTAPTGFTVTKFAAGFDHPRWMYVADNGDLFVAESNTILKGINKIGSKLSRKIRTQHYGTSANRVTLLRDRDKDGIYETRSVYLEGLNQPFGMLVLGNHFYVGNTDGLMMYDYDPTAISIATAGKQILVFPAGKPNRHWTRSLITNAAHNKIYIGVGSGSNVAENGLDYETNRAAIWEVNPDGSGMRIYASGLRNPVGLDWAPGTHTLWAAVNERDELGDELVPDYITGVKEGGFYGWPYSYFGQHLEPRIKEKEQRMDLVQKAIVPDVNLGPHTASLGFTFYTKEKFPAKYKNGAFVGQHGSWNRHEPSGYKVVYIPFNKKMAGKPEDFLTGFMANAEKNEVYGRPVGVTVLNDGSMLVADDAGNMIWRVSYVK